MQIQYVNSDIECLSWDASSVSFLQLWICDRYVFYTLFSFKWGKFYFCLFF